MKRKRKWKWWVLVVMIIVGIAGACLFLSDDRILQTHTMTAGRFEGLSPKGELVILSQDGLKLTNVETGENTISALSHLPKKGIVVGQIGFVYTSSTPGAGTRVVMVDWAGQELWSIQENTRMIEPVADSEGNVFFYGENMSVLCVDPFGIVRWEYDYPGGWGSFPPPPTNGFG